MAWRRDDRGSTSAIGFAIAAGLFAISFTAANLMVEEPPGVDHVGTQLNSMATTALDVIVAQPGRAATGEPWTNDADIIQRFGLALEGEENFLDYVKIKSMRNGTMVHATNKAPDYPDVRAATGITGGDFHLRTYPVLPGIDDPRWTKDPHGRVAYFAHYTGATGVASITHDIGVLGDSSPTLNVSVNVRNDGASDGIFVVNVGLGDQSSTQISDQRHTRLLAPGGSQTVWVEFPRLADWDDDFDWVRIDVADAYGNTLLQPSWHAGTPPEGGSATWGVTLAAGKVYYNSGETIVFTGDNYDGEGDELNADRTGRFALIGPTGAEMYNDTVTLPKGKNKVFTFECESPTCDAPGVYTGILWDAATITGSTNRAQDEVYVSSTEMFDEKKTLDPVAVREVNLLKQLMAGFNGVRFDDDDAPEGDVFGDDSHGPHELANALDKYTMIVIGSEVSQTALNAAPTKYGIAEWVQKGGTLIVLGTYSQQSNWLQPVYHAAQINANGGIGTPDPTHPVLHTPNKLDYQRYLDRARAWDIDNDAPFTHVLSRGSGGSSMIDTLAVAAPGAYNEGTVVLTSYMPGSLTEPQDEKEALRFLHNIMSQSYNMLFLDYGPPIPADVPVGSAQRLTAVPHPNVPGAVVEVRIVMYAWS